MKRMIIIFAIIVISISAVATAAAQNRGRKPVRQSVHVNGQSGNDQLSRNRNRSNRGVDRDTNHDGFINWGDGRTGVRRANSVTFEGNDEPLWTRSRRHSVNVSNVGPQINGNVRTKGFANTTFNDEARTSQLVQGNQIGTDRRPRRTGLFGDSNGDSDVDAIDYALKGSSPKTIPAGRRSGITGGDFNTDGPTTVGRSSMTGAARPQSLSAGTYGRGNRR